MPRPKKKSQEELERIAASRIAIAKAEDLNLARDCIRLLKDHDIEASIEAKDIAGHEDFFIRVEPGRFNEAYIVIESKITPEGFFDIFSENIMPSETNLPRGGLRDPNQAA